MVSKSTVVLCSSVSTWFKISKIFSMPTSFPCPGFPDESCNFPGVSSDVSDHPRRSPCKLPQILLGCTCVQGIRRMGYQLSKAVLFCQCQKFLHVSGIDLFAFPPLGFLVKNAKVFPRFAASAVPWLHSPWKKWYGFQYITSNLSFTTAAAPPP